MTSIGEPDGRLSASSWLDQLELPHTSPDSLGREAFARTLADALARLPTDRSVVTAVFGPWGCGKTWLLERIVRTLQDEHPTVIDICRFSPWELKSHEQILREFFSTIAGKIPPKAETLDLARLWAKLEELSMAGALGAGGLVSAVQISQGQYATGVPALFAALAGLCSKAFNGRKGGNKTEVRKTLAQVKDGLAEKLKRSLPRPILIVVDDLDRLTHGEIQLMIRLLNTTANLPKLHYLIFGDRLQIASALDPICGGEGDRYLEKMVQNSFQVPEPGENQIRLRLWEGIEEISKEAESPASNQGERFAEFWDAFLKLRIRNLRDSHRLLRTLAFHVGALMREEVLEVDLIDLLGVDFLRVFDPQLYHRIASEIPTKLWSHANLSGKPKEGDSKRVVDLVKSSALGDRVACGALISLFPHLGEHLKVLLEENQLQMLRYRSPRKAAPLGIGNVDRAEIYFRLDVAAGDLPEAKVREFAAAMGDSLRMIKLLEDFKSRKWLTQLFGRLRSDPLLIKDGNAAAGVLFAVSAVSDQLEDKMSLEEDEVRGMCRLSDELIARMAKDGLEREVLPAIRDAGEVTLALSLLEEIRDASGHALFSGARACQGLVRLSEGEIEALSDELLSLVSRRFWQDHFMSQEFDAWRAYRMAHALGPTRTEEVLKFAIEGSHEVKIWKLVEAIAVSVMTSSALDSWEEEEGANAAGQALLAHLTRFASANFWKSLVSGEICDPPTPFSRLLLRHLERAIRDPEVSGHS
jgi:hypothetical protein